MDFHCGMGAALPWKKQVLLWGTKLSRKEFALSSAK